MRELIIFQRQRLKADPDLITIMGNSPIVDPPQVYLVESTKDSEFPFIVQHCTQDTVEPWGIYTGLFDFHIWDYGQSKARAFLIRDRIFALFERLYYPTISGTPVSSVRYRLQSQHWVPETDSKVQHLVMRFGVRWVSNLDIQTVLDREGV